MKPILGTLLACVAATSALTTPAATAVAARATTSYDVGFGEAVVARSGETVRVSFDGRRGQLVTLRTSVGQDADPVGCESIVLTRRGATIDQRFPGVWRLPATGTFRVTYTQTCEEPYKGYTYDSRLTLAEVVLGRLGDALRHGVRSEAATVRGISVRLGDRPLLLDEAYVVPARRPAAAENARQSWCATNRIVSGKRPVTIGGDECAFRARAGARYLVFGTKGSTVRYGRG